MKLAGTGCDENDPVQSVAVLCCYRPVRQRESLGARGKRTQEQAEADSAEGQEKSQKVSMTANNNFTTQNVGFIPFIISVGQM